MPSNPPPNVPGRSANRQPGFVPTTTHRAIATAALCGFCWTMSGCGKSESPQTATAVSTAAPAAVDETQTVARLISGIAANDPAVFAAVDPDHFAQHDLSIEGGLLGLKAYAAAIPAGSMKITPVRMFRDGDFVVVHSVIESAQPQVVIDVYQFGHGKIIAHWDNLQDRYPDPNPSGRTQTDGTTAVGAGDAEANKALARKFVTEVLINEKLDGFDVLFDGDNYIQHDPGASDGAGVLKNAIAGLAAAKTPVGYENVRRVLGQGNLVLVMSDGTRSGKRTAFFDLFRIENGKLAEHWSASQPIPPAETWKNNDGKF